MTDCVLFLTHHFCYCWQQQQGGSPPLSTMVATLDDKSSKNAGRDLREVSIVTSMRSNFSASTLSRTSDGIFLLLSLYLFNALTDMASVPELAMECGWRRMLALCLMWGRIFLFEEVLQQMCVENSAPKPTRQKSNRPSMIPPRPPTL